MSPRGRTCAAWATAVAAIAASALAAGAPYWHGSRVMDPASHRNYHLGFRCCKTLEPRPAGSADSGPGGLAPGR